MLEVLTCGRGGSSELTKILLVPDERQAALQAYRSAVCSGGEGLRARRFSQISQELREQIDTRAVMEKVPLAEVFVTELSGKRRTGHDRSILPNVS